MSNYVVKGVLIMDYEERFNHPSYYNNREISWLAFNERVLQEAVDKRNPLLERIKFLAMIRKLKSGEYRLYSRKKNPKTNKRRNLGTFKSLEAAKKHEKAVQYFKHSG